MRCEFVEQTEVAVRTIPDLLAVDPDGTFHINTVKIDEDEFALPVVSPFDLFLIPADSGGKMAVGPVSRHILVVGLFDTPVMGHVKQAPGSVIDGLGTVFQIAEVKIPIEINVFHHPEGGGSGGN